MPTTTTPRRLGEPTNRDRIALPATVVAIADSRSCVAELPNGHRLRAVVKKNSPINIKDFLPGDGILVFSSPYDLERGHLAVASRRDSAGDGEGEGETGERDGARPIE